MNDTLYIAISRGSGKSWDEETLATIMALSDKHKIVIMNGFEDKIPSKRLRKKEIKKSNKTIVKALEKLKGEIQDDKT